MKFTECILSFSIHNALTWQLFNPSLYQYASNEVITSSLHLYLPSLGLWHWHLNFTCAVVESKNEKYSSESVCLLIWKVRQQKRTQLEYESSDYVIVSVNNNILHHSLCQCFVPYRSFVMYCKQLGSVVQVNPQYMPAIPWKTAQLKMTMGPNNQPFADN